MREFIVLAKKDCQYCEKVEHFFEDHPEFESSFFYSNIDFQDKEFKDDFGKNATYPRVYEVKMNGEKVFFGDSKETIKKLS